jgi:hypothetical protein
MDRKVARWRRRIVLLVALLLLGLLYVLELTRVEYGGNAHMAGLDHLEYDKAGEAWEPFYRVRATLIDGQHAEFSIPEVLLEQQGGIMELEGAGSFYAAGCHRNGDSVRVSEFYLLPSTGLAEACELMPDVEMRWTIRVLLEDHWDLHYEDMILNRCRVRGRFLMDTSRPYEGIFFLEEARAMLIPDNPRH